MTLSLKPTRPQRNNVYFLFELSDDPEKLNNTQLSPYQTFFSKLRNKNPLERDYPDFQSLIDGGLTSKEAILKLKLKQPPATGQENYEHLTSVWKQQNMCTCKDFLRWYNNEHVVSTLGAIKKVADFFQNKGIDMLNFGCTLPNFANNCLHKSFTAKCYPSQRTTMIYWRKNVKTWLVHHP